MNNDDLNEADYDIEANNSILPSVRPSSTIKAKPKVERAKGPEPGSRPSFAPPLDFGALVHTLASHSPHSTRKDPAHTTGTGSSANLSAAGGITLPKKKSPAAAARLALSPTSPAALQLAQAASTQPVPNRKQVRSMIKVRESDAVNIDVATIPTGVGAVHDV